MAGKLRVGVIGAGRWAASAHLPGFTRSPLSEVVAICDLDRDLADARAREFGIPEVMTDADKLLARSDVDVVDIVTRGDHQDLVFEALGAGKHVLVEKPVCHDYRDVVRAHQIAQSKGLKTKVGLTFRYAPAVMYMFDLIREGFIGRPFVFNGYEQNSQWLNPDNPMDKRIHKVKPEGEAPWGVDLTREGIAVSSLEGYGAPTIDIGLECVGEDLKQVVGILSNMVPFRRRTNLDQDRERINIDDADMFMGETAERSAVLDAVELRHGGELSRHRGADLRLGRGHQGPARGGVRGDPDHPHREAGCRRVRGARDSREILPPRFPDERPLEHGFLWQSRP